MKNIYEISYKIIFEFTDKNVDTKGYDIRISEDEFSFIDANLETLIKYDLNRCTIVDIYIKQLCYN